MKSRNCEGMEKVNDRMQNRTVTGLSLDLQRISKATLSSLVKWYVDHGIDLCEAYPC